MKGELHNKTSWLRDIILGGQDGLVNVLGIVLGVAAANGDTKILITASVAAAFAEAVSMGAVAYTSAYAQKDHYQKELEREKYEIDNLPENEKQEVRNIYAKKGFSGDLLDKIVKKIISNKEIWLNTMMNEELGLEKIETKTILVSSLVVGVAALISSFIPIVPFLFFDRQVATIVTLIVSSATLFATGAYEAKIYIGSWWKNGLQMAIIGMGAALVGFIIGRIFGAQ